MLDHDWEVYNLDEYIEEYLTEILSKKITKKQHKELSVIVKDYPFDYLFE